MLSFTIIVLLLSKLMGFFCTSGNFCDHESKEKSLPEVQESRRKKKNFTVKSKLEVMMAPTRQRTWRPFKQRLH